MAQRALGREDLLAPRDHFGVRPDSGRDVRVGIGGRDERVHVIPVLVPRAPAGVRAPVCRCGNAAHGDGQRDREDNNGQSCANHTSLLLVNGLGHGGPTPEQTSDFGGVHPGENASNQMRRDECNRKSGGRLAGFGGSPND